LTEVFYLDYISELSAAAPLGKYEETLKVKQQTKMHMFEE
jgi:hypothetical protein